MSKPSAPTQETTSSPVATPSLNINGVDPSREPNHCSISTERVIIFKSGFCLFVKKLQGVPADPNNPFLWIDAVPDNACLGTFWTLPGNPDTAILNSQSSLVTTVERKVEQIPCKTNLELLKENIGKEISVRVLDPFRPKIVDPISQKSIDGILKTVIFATEQPESSQIEEPEKDKPLLDYTFRNRRVQVYRQGNYSGPSPSYRANRGAPTHFIVTLPNGFDRVIATNPATNQQQMGLIDFAIKNMKTTKERVTIRTKSSKRLHINFSKNPANPTREFRIIYLCPGIRWIPTYRIALLSSHPETPSAAETATEGNAPESDSQAATETKSKNTKPKSPRSPRSGGSLFSKFKKAIVSDSIPPPTSIKDIPVSGAKLALQAEVLNEIEDIENATIDFVVGIAKFNMQDTISPLALSQSVTNALLTAAPQIMGVGGSRSQRQNFRSRAGERRSSRQPPMQMMQMQQMQVLPDMSNALMPNDPTPDAPNSQLPDFDSSDSNTKSASDLFVYSAHNVTIAKGARVAVPLIVESSELPFRNFYTWDLNLTSNANTLSSAEASSGHLAIREIEVWHKISITNSTATPLTTGPVLITQDDTLLPLTQQMIYYTSIGSSVTVPLTRAINTRAYVVSQEETKRKLKAKKISNSHYCKIEKTAVLAVKNNHSFPIFIDITIRLGGHANSASDGGSISLSSYNGSDWSSYAGSSTANNSSSIRYRAIKIDGHKEFRPKISYHYFVLQGNI